MSTVAKNATVANNLIKLDSLKLKKKSKSDLDQPQQQKIFNSEQTLVPAFKFQAHHTVDLQHIFNSDKVMNIVQQDTFFANNNETSLMIQNTVGHESSSRVQNILSQMEHLKFEEKLLIYLKLPAYFVNPNIATDPLKQPLNPLGNRYEIHQTIMWIKTHLEEDPEVSLPKQDVYDEYNIFCSKNNMKPLSTADFGKVMKQVYPKVRPRRLGTRGNSRYCYAGMRKKLVLRPPTLPSIFDEQLEKDVEDDTKEDMLEAASVIIREWAQTQFSMKFPTLCTLGKYLVDNLFVDNHSLAAVCLMGSLQDSEAPTVSKGVIHGLSQTVTSRNVEKSKNVQVQLQQKIQYGDKIYQTPNNCQSKSMCNNYQIEESVDSREEDRKKSKRSKGKLNGYLTKGSTSMSTKMDKINLLPNHQHKNINRSNDLPSTSSLQSICDNLKVQFFNDEKIDLPYEIISEREKISRKNGLPKKARKRVSSCGLKISEIDERSPDKLLKLIDSNLITFDDSTDRPSTQHPLTSIELDPIRTPMILSMNSKITKCINTNVDQPLKTCDKSLPLCSKSYPKLQIRSEGSNLQSSLSKNDTESQKQEGIRHNDTIENYLTINNSQEQEEELLQYFQQSNSSSSDVELNIVSDIGEITSQRLRREKVSQLRIILQENLKDLLSTPKKSSRNETLAKQLNEQVLNKMISPNVREEQNDSHCYVRCDIKLAEKCPGIVDGNDSIVGGTCINTNIPSSPNTRRRIFNFTPISPTPSHSSVHTTTSKCSSTEGSPFVSPRNTPMLRSRSNLQKNSNWRGRSFQKQPVLRSTSSCNDSNLSDQNSFVAPATQALPTIEELNNESQILDTSCVTHPFLTDLTSQQPQLLINYPSHENLQEIKDASSKQPQPTDKEISDLLLNEKQISFVKDQGLFYRSRSVPLHHMVNPALLSPILTHQLTPTPTPMPTPTLTPTPITTPISFLNVPRNVNVLNNNSSAPNLVHSDCNDLSSTAVKLKFYLEDKKTISNDLNILETLKNEKVDISNPFNTVKIGDQRNPDQVTVDSPEVINEQALISELNSKWFENVSASVSVNPSQLINAPVKNIHSRSYPNTPLPLVNSYVTLHCFEDSNASKSYPNTPRHYTQSLNSYSSSNMEINEPMLCSPIFDQLTLQNTVTSHITNNCPSDNECYETEFLEPHIHSDETDNIDSLTNFDQLQEVATLTPLFTEVVDTNN